MTSSNSTYSRAELQRDVLRDEESPAGEKRGKLPVGGAPERVPPQETSPIKRAPGGAPVPEVPSVEEALRRARAPAPGLAPRRDANLGVEVNPRRQPHEKVSM